MYTVLIVHFSNNHTLLCLFAIIDQLLFTVIFI